MRFQFRLKRSDSNDGSRNESGIHSHCSLNNTNLDAWLSARSFPELCRPIYCSRSELQTVVLKPRKPRAAKLILRRSCSNVRWTHDKQWHRNESESGAVGHTSTKRQKKNLSCPSAFLALQIQLVVLV